MLSYHRTAYKHIADATLLDEIVRHVVAARRVDDDDPPRSLMVGIDRAGRQYELVVLHTAHGDVLIHAMRARRSFLREVYL